MRRWFQSAIGSRRFSALLMLVLMLSGQLPRLHCADSHHEAVAAAAGHGAHPAAHDEGARPNTEDSQSECTMVAACVAVSLSAATITFAPAQQITNSSVQLHLSDHTDPTLGKNTPPPRSSV